MKCLNKFTLVEIKNSPTAQLKKGLKNKFKITLTINLFLLQIFPAGLTINISFAQIDKEDSAKAVFMLRETGKYKLNELYIYDDCSYVYYKLYDNKEYEGFLSPTEEEQISELINKYNEIQFDTAYSYKNSKTSVSWGLWGFGKKENIDSEDLKKIQLLIDSLVKSANKNIYMILPKDTEEESKDAVLIFRENDIHQFNKLYISKTYSFTYFKLLLNQEYKGFLSADEEKKLTEFTDKYGEIHWTTLPESETGALSQTWSLWGFGEKKEIDDKDKEKIRSIINLLIERVIHDSD
ncbi:MAG: hypothetical protein AB1498_05065 [bacterium]